MTGRTDSVPAVLGLPIDGTRRSVAPVNGLDVSCTTSTFTTTSARSLGGCQSLIQVLPKLGVSATFRGRKCPYDEICTGRQRVQTLSNKVSELAFYPISRDCATNGLRDDETRPRGMEPGAGFG